MCGFKIKKISDDSIIDIISMNIDNDNCVLISKDGSLDIISLNKFKDMIMGENANSENGDGKIKEATYKIIK